MEIVWVYWGIEKQPHRNRVARMLHDSVPSQISRRNFTRLARSAAELTFSKKNDVRFF